MKPKKRRKQKATRQRYNQQPRPAPLPTRRYQRSLVAVALAVASLFGVATEIYEMFDVTPKVAVVPGLTFPIAFRIENSSYVNLVAPTLQCHFRVLDLSGLISFNDSTTDGSWEQRTDVIRPGSAKIAGCGIRTPGSTIAAADITVKLRWHFRCLPFLAICRSAQSFRFRLVGSTWVEGESFAPSN